MKRIGDFIITRNGVINTKYIQGINKEELDFEIILDSMVIELPSEDYWKFVSLLTGENVESDTTGYIDYNQLAEKQFQEMAVFLQDSVNEFLGSLSATARFIGNMFSVSYFGVRITLIFGRSGVFYYQSLYTDNNCSRKHKNELYNLKNSKEFEDLHNKKPEQLSEVIICAQTYELLKILQN